MHASCQLDVMHAVLVHQQWVYYIWRHSSKLTCTPLLSSAFRYADSTGTSAVGSFHTETCQQADLHSFAKQCIQICRQHCHQCFASYWDSCMTGVTAVASVHTETLQQADLHSFAKQCIQICRQHCHQCLALPGAHFCNLALVQNHATYELDIKWTQAKDTLGGLSDNLKLHVSTLAECRLLRAGHNWLAMKSVVEVSLCKL